MAFQSVPNTAAVHFRATLFGIPVENSIYVTAGSGYGQSEIDDIAEIADTVWDSDMMAVLSEDYLYTETYVKGLASSVDFEATNIDHAAGIGQIAVASMPGNVAFAVKFLTGHTGRSARGRNFVAGIPQDGVTDNTLETVYTTAYRDAYIALKAALALGGYPMVVVSRQTAGAIRPTGVTFAVTTITFTDNTLDSQRGRLH